MSGNTAAAQHDLAPHNRDMGIEFDVRHTTDNIEENIVTDAEPEDDANSPNGGLRAWLYVLATFFMFISAW